MRVWALVQLASASPLACASKYPNQIQCRRAIQDLTDVPLCTTLEHILFRICEKRTVDPHNCLQHGNNVLKAVAATPERQNGFSDAADISVDGGHLEALQEGYRGRIHEELDIGGRHGAGWKCTADQRELADIPSAEGCHCCEGIGGDLGGRGFSGSQDSCVDVKRHGMELENNTATLDRLDEVLGTLGNETETGLVGIEFHDTPEGLLDNHMVLAVDVVGVIEEHPGGGAGDGAALADELREPLAYGDDTALIGRAESERHGGLLGGIGNTLGNELFRNPGIRQHRFASAGGSPQNQVGRRCEALPKEGDSVRLTKNGVH